MRIKEKTEIASDMQKPQTIRQITEQYGLGASNLRNRIKAGTLEYTRVGKIFFIRPCDLFKINPTADGTN